MVLRLAAIHESTVQAIEVRENDSPLGENSDPRVVPAHTGMIEDNVVRIRAADGDDRCGDFEDLGVFLMISND